MSRMIASKTRRFSPISILIANSVRIAIAATSQFRMNVIVNVNVKYEIRSLLNDANDEEIRIVR